VIWFLACTTASPWTPSAALDPTLRRLDTDQDARVSAEELAVVAPGLDFSGLDTDGSGDLTTDELVNWMDTTDPLTFDRRFGRPPVTRDQAAAQEVMHPEVRMLMDLFLFLSEELAAAAPDVPRPNEHHLRSAAATASLSSPQSVAVLTSFRSGFTSAGLTFPPGLEPR
jgi:hypothetical protein